MTKSQEYKVVWERELIRNNQLSQAGIAHRRDAEARQARGSYSSFYDNWHDSRYRRVDTSLVVTQQLEDEQLLLAHISSAFSNAEQQNCVYLSVDDARAASRTGFGLKFVKMFRANFGPASY